MFGRFKKWIGIEGAKLQLHVLPSYPKKVKTINGELEISAQSVQKIKHIRLILVEIYTQGKGEEQQKKEFLLGKWELEQSFVVDAQNPKMLFFKLPFEFKKSRMDRLSEKGKLRGRLVQLAKSMKGISSTYRLEAQVEIEGLDWKPFAKATIIFNS